MPLFRTHRANLLAALLLASAPLFAQQGTTAAQAPNTDSSYIDADGTAHITRVIPVPPDLSPEAKKSLSRPISDAAHPQSLEERRRGTDVWQNHAGDVSAQLYPVARVRRHHRRRPRPHRHPAFRNRSRPRPPQHSRRRLQLRLRLVDRIHPYRQSHKNQSRRRPLSTRTRASLPCRTR